MKKAVLELKIEQGLGVELPNGVEVSGNILKINDRGLDLISVEYPDSFNEFDEDDMAEWTVSVDEAFEALAVRISEMTGLEWVVDDFPGEPNYVDGEGSEHWWRNGVVCRNTEEPNP